MRVIPVLLVTYNRLVYSEQALESICRNPGIAIDLTVFDNNSTDGTKEWLSTMKERQHPNTRHFKIHYSTKNVGLAPAMNQFFRENADAPYVVKVDNDTVLPDNWLADLMDVMESQNQGNWIGAVSGTCDRPPGLTAADWYAGMAQLPFKHERLFFNPACLGTGVLINMEMIRERGLLFEKFPRSPDSGPNDPCLISGWGAYIQEASADSKWKFAMYSKVPVTLLNLKEDQVLSNDYPEYDAEVKKVRDEGNAWWESVGGLPGVKKYVEEHGGLEPLFVPRHYSVDLKVSHEELKQSAYWHGKDPILHMPVVNDYPWDSPSGVHWPEDPKDLPPAPVMSMGQYQYLQKRLGATPELLTEADNLQERSTLEFWLKRVDEHGTTHSTFLSTPQSRIVEFTERHLPFIRQYVTGNHVLDCGCGWGRMSKTIADLAETYVGVDFVPALIEKAKESLPNLTFKVEDVTKGLSFADETFEVVVAITCLSSWAAVFPQVLAELHRVLRPEGVILFLEERFVRIDWKLESQ